MKLDQNLIFGGMLVITAIAIYFWVTQKCRFTTTPPFTWCGESDPPPDGLSPGQEQAQAAMYAQY